MAQEEQLGAQEDRLETAPQAKRAGTPPLEVLCWLAEEVAALAVYLASDEAAFTTGQTHIIDGGLIG